MAEAVNEQTFDRKIALFCLSCSNLILVNALRELDIEMKNIIEICIVN